MTAGKQKTSKKDNKKKVNKKIEQISDYSQKNIYLF